MEKLVTHLEQEIGDWRSELELRAGQRMAGQSAAALVPAGAEAPCADRVILQMPLPTVASPRPVAGPLAEVFPAEVEIPDAEPEAEAEPIFDATEAETSAGRDGEFREEGLRLLKQAGGPLATASDLMMAGENFHHAYADAREGALKASDIANCGITLWFAALAFFRLGAQLNLRGCKSGAPDELFLTMALRPAEFPGGDVGSRMRSALNPEHINQLVRLVELAMVCFRKSVQLDPKGIGSMWQLILNRGIGNFSECIALANTAATEAGPATEAFLKGIPAYQADFARLICAPCNAHVPESDWLNRTILHSMAPICQLLEADASLAPVRNNHPRLLSSAEGITLATCATDQRATRARHGAAA